MGNPPGSPHPRGAEGTQGHFLTLPDTLALPLLMRWGLPATSAPRGAGCLLGGFPAPCEP